MSKCMTLNYCKRARMTEQYERERERKNFNFSLKAIEINKNM